MAVNSFREDEQMSGINQLKIVKRLIAYLFEYKVQVACVMICMAIAIAISLVNPLLIEDALDIYVVNGDIPGLLKLGILAIVINLVYIVVIKIRIFLMAKMTNKILMDIRQNLYEHIQTLSFSFFDSRPSGKILARIIGDVNSLKDLFNNFVTTLLPELITVVGVLVIMLIKDWRLAAASLCMIPVMAGGIFFIQKMGHTRWGIFRKKSSNLNAYVHEDIAGISVVQSLHAEKETKETFKELTDEHKAAFMSAVTFSDMFFPIVDFSWGVGVMMLYLVAVKMLGIQVESVGILVAFSAYVNMFWNPISNLSNFYNNLITNLSAAERIFDILDTEADIKNEEDAMELPKITGAVDFYNVNFTYDRGTPAETKVLENVSFHVNPGETIALVGPTGAGKTTIVNLISRFYDIEDGTICIDGYDLTKVSIHSLRDQMGVMTQDNFIFQGTVKENILYGKLDATDEEVIAAAKAVSAHDFIMKMEKGYDTVLKEQGAGLSIGQRQLIAFARTMISQPSILILDEATSSIDTHTELLVQKGIEALLSGRTSFVIAHRLSTIQNADRIFVIDRGGILEQGTPKELMDKQGAYYDLYMAQFAEVV